MINTSHGKSVGKYHMVIRVKITLFDLEYVKKVVCRRIKAYQKIVDRQNDEKPMKVSSKPLFGKNE